MTELQGFAESGRIASFASVTYMGIVTGSDPMSQTFAQFWFEQAYGDWLAVEPERKTPLYLGVEQEWADTWRDLPLASGNTLDEQYPSASTMLLSALLMQNNTAFERWGFGTGREQLIATLYEDLTIAPVLTRMLNGYISSNQALLDATEDIFDAAIVPPAP